MSYEIEVGLREGIIVGVKDGAILGMVVGVGLGDGVTVGVMMQFWPVKLYCPNVDVPDVQLFSPSGLREYDLPVPGLDLYA